MADRLLTSLLERCGLSDAALREGRVVAVKTEAHIFAKYPFLANGALPVMDVSSHRVAGGVRSRRRAARGLRRALRAWRRERQVDGPVFVLDASEGWFATTTVYALREVFPGAKLIGLQHGVMEVTGAESTILVRRFRRWVTRLQYRVWGAALIGAGFGNNSFDAYACYGAWYEEYIRRLCPDCGIVRAFAELSGLTDSSPDPSTNGYDLVFLSQDLSSYGIRNGDDLHRQIIHHLTELASRHDWRIALKMHPKHRLEVDGVLGERCDVIRDGRVVATLAPGRTIVVSFNSTGLFDAAYLNCPIVALRLPRIGAKWYAMFEASVPLPEFLTGWNADRFSQLRAGVID